MQVMRLHAFAIRKLPPLSSSSNAAAPQQQQQQQPAAVPRTLPGHLAAHLPLLRQRALSLLAAPLAGDTLAAEYLLLAALGSVSCCVSCFYTLCSCNKFVMANSYAAPLAGDILAADTCCWLHWGW
jgi:hypothetical protein